MTHTARSLLDPAIWNGQLLGADGWTPGSAKLCVIEKATGAELGVLGQADASDVAAAAARAADAQREWAATSHEQRAAILRAAAQAWLAHAGEINHWIMREAGSIPPKAALETHFAAQECFEAASLADRPGRGGCHHAGLHR
jgi:benzaldehyde dehydrogenase (NAD)